MRWRVCCLCTTNVATRAVYAPAIVTANTIMAAAADATIDTTTATMQAAATDIAAAATINATCADLVYAVAVTPSYTSAFRHCYYQQI